MIDVTIYPHPIDFVSICIIRPLFRFVHSKGVTYDEGGQVIDRSNVLFGMLWELYIFLSNWFEAKIPKEVRTGCDGTAQRAQIDSLVWVIGCDTPFVLIKLERASFHAPNK